MRVSKLSCLNGPEPEPTKLLSTVAFAGSWGSAPRIAPAAGEILPMGIQLGSVAQLAGPQNCVRLPPLPIGGVVVLPVAGSKTCPPPATPTAALAYSLRSQKPGVALVAFVAGLQVCWTSFV